MAEQKAAAATNGPAAEAAPVKLDPEQLKVAVEKVLVEYIKDAETFVITHKEKQAGEISCATCNTALVSGTNVSGRFVLFCFGATLLKSPVN